MKETSKKDWQSEYRDFNDSLWVDARSDYSYYEGKLEGARKIDLWLDECETPKGLSAIIAEEKKTVEASRDAANGDDFAYYDGMVATYREMLEELKKGE